MTPRAVATIGLVLWLGAGRASATFEGGVVRLADFNGLNDTTVSTNIEDNQSPSCLNVRFPLGAIQRRAGYSKLVANRPSSTDAISSLTQAIFASGTTNLVATSGVSVSSLSGSTWTDRTGALTFASGADKNIDWCMFTDLLIGSDNESRVVKWAGSADIAALGGSPPTAFKAIASFRNYLILGNTLESATRYKTRIRWSGLNNAESWPSANFNTILNNVGDEILDLVPLADSLYIFMRRSIWRMDYTGNSAVPFRFTNVSPNRGCISPRGQARVRNVIYFASDNGMYAFNGGEPAYLSKRIEVGWDQRNKARDPYVVALHNQRFNEVWFVFSDAAETTNANAYVLDYERNAWTRFSNIVANVGLIYEDSSNDQLLVTGSYDGYLHLQNDTDADDGASISASYFTKWFHFDDSLRYKQLKVVQLEANSESTETEVDIGYAFDFGTIAETLSFSLQQMGSSVFGAGLFGTATFSSLGQVLASKPTKNRGRFIQFVISNTGASKPFTVFGLTMGLVGEK